jgi:predicted DNA-binding transcriptional regulator AlpA
MGLAQIGSIMRVRSMKFPNDPTIYRMVMKETRWGAVFPRKFVPVLKIEGNVPRLRARSAHLVGHLPWRKSRILAWISRSCVLNHIR